MSVRTVILSVALVSMACKDHAKDLERQAAALKQECSDERQRQAEECSDMVSECMAHQVACPTPAAETFLEFDKTYAVTIGDHVVVENRVSDGHRRYRRGDDCRIDPGGTLVVLDVRRSGDELGHWAEYLVRYARPPADSDHYVPPTRDAAPFLCPDGTTFYYEDPLFISEEP